MCKEMIYLNLVGEGKERDLALWLWLKNKMCMGRKLPGGTSIGLESAFWLHVRSRLIRSSCIALSEHFHTLGTFQSAHSLWCWRFISSSVVLSIFLRGVCGHSTVVAWGTGKLSRSTTTKTPTFTHQRQQKKSLAKTIIALRIFHL